MNRYRPVIGITMGDPVGIGPEVILKALRTPLIYEKCRPLVIGDIRIMDRARQILQSPLNLGAVSDPKTGRYELGGVDVLCCSDIDPDKASWARPAPSTGKAMIGYITTATRLALEGKTAAVVTCPINKTAMKMAGSEFHGHTELIAQLTRTEKYCMMLAGSRLRVVLVTIHIPLRDVAKSISADEVENVIEITGHALKARFGIAAPCIAVAALNPHAGEEGMFGDEEEKIIVPGVTRSKAKGFKIHGPLPPDTVFYHALNGAFDAVVCMYHDQGLIPFKMIHFKDGVNTTLGLPIIRTSVDHGTAYDIAGTGKADPGSLIAAIEMAVTQAVISGKGKNELR